MHAAVQTLSKEDLLHCTACADKVDPKRAHKFVCTRLVCTVHFEAHLLSVLIVVPASAYVYLFEQTRSVHFIAWSVCFFVGLCVYVGMCVHVYASERASVCLRMYELSLSCAQ